MRLFKRNVDGSVQFWEAEAEAGAYRTWTGKYPNGALVESEPTLCAPKNVGRSNETTAQEQATKEVAALYKKKLEGEYHERLEDIDRARFFKPMLAHKYKGEFEPCFSQPKLDGVRCITNKDGMFSRTGKPITSCPHILEALEHLFRDNPNIVLDGELYNHDLADDFNKIISIVRKAKPSEEDLVRAAELVEYHVYDLPSDPGPFLKRHQALMFHFDMANIWMAPIVCQVDTVKCSIQDELDALYETYMRDGYEGQMVRLDLPYEQKRSKSLLKRKEFEDREFPVVDIEEGLGNWAGHAKRITLELPDGRTFGAGLKGNKTYARGLLRDKDQYVGGQATVRYQSLTPDGVPRFPVVYTFHPGKRDL